MKSIEVYLDIYGFSLDPSQAEQILCVLADERQTAGVVPQGCKTPAKENSLSFYSKIAEEEELDRHIDNILSKLDFDKIQNLSKQGALLTLRVVVRIPEGQSSPCSALFIGKFSMKKLALIDCDIDLDVYG